MIVNKNQISYYLKALAGSPGKSPGVALLHLVNELIVRVFVAKWE